MNSNFLMYEKVESIDSSVLRVSLSSFSIQRNEKSPQNLVMTGMSTPSNKNKNQGR